MIRFVAAVEWKAVGRLVAAVVMADGAATAAITISGEVV